MRLARAGADLTTAAHQGGFSSSAHFSAVYREMFGLTPSALLASLTL
jgi:AraC-like DNA-binding protein